MIRYFALVDPSRAGAMYTGHPVLIVCDGLEELRQRAYTWAAAEMVEQNPSDEQVVQAVGDPYEEYTCGHGGGAQYTVLLAPAPGAGGTEAGPPATTAQWLAVVNAYDVPPSGVRPAVTLCGFCMARAEGLGAEEGDGGGSAGVYL